MKHLKHLFTALLLLCSTVVAAYDFEVDGIYYNILSEVNNTVEVTPISGSDEYTGSVVIPKSVNYYGITYRVTSIGDGAFWYCTGLTSVVIGNSVTSIGSDAFSGCSGLKTVYNCSSLNIVKGSTDNGYVATFQTTKRIVQLVKASFY